MNKNICAVRHTCRICGSPDLHPVIDLGSQYIASIFVEDEVPSFLQQPYPLEVVRCAASDGCGLVQLRHTISPDVLYSNYGYRSGTNEMMRAHLRDIAAKIEQMVDLRGGDIVLDIGCNDGTLLDSYQTAGIDKLGFDPAGNVVESARQKGLDVVNDFFSFQSYVKVRPNMKVRVITSIAMFYDLENPRQFIRDVASVLSDDGIWVLELSYLPLMLQKNSYDTICHEHLEYYALKPIEGMLQREQLQVHRIEFNDINGGSFRLYIRKDTFGPVLQHDRLFLDKVRADERALGLDKDRPYMLFREAVSRLRGELRGLLVELREAGKSVYVYGASTKGNIILQFCGIDNALVAKAADRNPMKWGMRTLGTGIPIVSEEEARSENPDYFLVLPWHFLASFINREKIFLNRGGKFIVPLPEVQIVGKDEAVRMSKEVAL
jgi:NDP-4-keto-2,6-dideoxyhexose 3-C-methyltransferase